MGETETEQQQPETTEAEEAEEAAEEEAPSEAQPEEEALDSATVEASAEPQGASPEEWETRFKKAEKAFAAYTRRISDLWEEDASDLVPVSLSPSAPPGFIYTHDAGRVPDEVKEPILAFFGMPVERDLKYDPAFPTCERCDGEGKIKTGSHDPKWRSLTCKGCMGRGFVEAGAPGVNGPTELAAVPVAVGAEEPSALQDDADVWGHPKLLPDGADNPNFGRSPQYIDPRFP